MKNLNNKSDAATSSKTRRQDKKETNTKVNPVINFQIGLITALVAAFLIIELNTGITDQVYQPSDKDRTIVLESNMGAFTIVPNDPVQKNEPPVKKTPVKNIEPVKINDKLPPEVVDNKENIEPNSPTLDPTDTADVQPLKKDNVGNVGSKSNTAPANDSPGTAHLATVHEVPLFPGCSPRLDRTERIQCLNQKMARYVQRKFDTSLERDLGSDRIAITVQFTIGVDGYPTHILVKAPNKALQEEAKTVISKLPKMTPGKVDGAAVNVTYTLPIQYRLQ